MATLNCSQKVFQLITLPLNTGTSLLGSLRELSKRQDSRVACLTSSSSLSSKSSIIDSLVTSLSSCLISRSRSSHWQMTHLSTGVEDNLVTSFVISVTLASRHPKHLVTSRVWHASLDARICSDQLIEVRNKIIYKRFMFL